jgi:hypothetical protein
LLEVLEVLDVVVFDVVVFDVVVLLDFELVVVFLVVLSVGLEPIDVGVDSVTTDSAVSFSDTETNARSDTSEDTVVATVVARSDAVPHPNWEKPPANSFL